MTAPRDVLARVRAVIVQSLGVDEEDVLPAATLVGELGAESIDFLDITFRLEREFGIKVPRCELFIDPTSLGGVGREPDDRLTATDLAALRRQMPYADLSGIGLDRRPENLTDLFTVDLLVRYVAWKLERGRGDAEGTGATVFTAPPAIGR